MSETTEISPVAPPVQSVETKMILVDGDRYGTGFILPAHKILCNKKCEFWDKKRRPCLDEKACLTCFHAGAEFVTSFIDGLANTTIAKRVSFGGSFLMASKIVRLITLMRTGCSASKKGNGGGVKPCVIRAKEKSDDPIYCSGINVDPKIAFPGNDAAAKSVLVHWIARPDVIRYAGHGNPITHDPKECAFHIQIGALTGRKAIYPARIRIEYPPGWLAKPTEWRIIVTCLDEICPGARIRRALSYDSMVVDILRSWRGYENDPAYTKKFKDMVGRRNLPKRTCIVVRLNNSALLVYQYMHGETVKSQRERACLYFHKNRPDPRITPDQGFMIGYNALIGASLAIKLRDFATLSTLNLEWFDEALKDTLWLQREYYDQGYVHFMRDDISGDPDIVKSFAQRLHKAFEKRKEEEKDCIIHVPIAIRDAVSHHSLWHVAHDRLKLPEQDRKTKMEEVEKHFTEMAMSWLCDRTDPEKDKDQVSIVKIGKLRLVDRREIEDVLSLRHVLLHYADSDCLRKEPLNLAVFGAPGAGKSFTVKEVAADVGGAVNDYGDKPLEFNLSQFTSLADYAEAFNQVRNECLTGKIPLVFFR